MDRVKRYDGLQLLNEHGDLYFLLHKFGVQIIPCKLEKLKRIIEGEKDRAKSVHVARYVSMKTRTVKATT